MQNTTGLFDYCYVQSVHIINYCKLIILMLLRLPAKYINLEVNGIEPPPKKKKFKLSHHECLILCTTDFTMTKTKYVI